MSQVLRPPLRLHSLLPIGGLEQGKAIDKAARFLLDGAARRREADGCLHHPFSP